MSDTAVQAPSRVELRLDIVQLQEMLMAVQRRKVILSKIDTDEAGRTRAVLSGLESMIQAGISVVS